MDSYRLKIKIGPHEFEAEGPPESVTAQFETWKEMVGAAGTAAAPAESPEPKDTEGGENVSGPLPNVFAVDRPRRLVTLRVFPTGPRRDADSMLLLLWGYRQAFGEDDVMVGRLKESMAISGRQLDRVDRTIAPHQTAGLVLKGGQGKGGRYRLTNTGSRRAEELLEALTT